MPDAGVDVGEGGGEGRRPAGGLGVVVGAVGVSWNRRGLGRAGGL